MILSHFAKYLRGTDFVSKLFFLLGTVMLIPLFVLIFTEFNLQHMFAFLIPAIISYVIGFIFNLRKPSLGVIRVFGRQNEIVTVVVIWLYAFVSGTIPFVFSNQLDFPRALFEAVSGWTTTGLSVMDVEKTPEIFLFYRSLMQYCGGLGFVLLMLLFASGKSSMQLFSAEGHADKLDPNLKSTARTIMMIYTGFTLSGAILYFVFGMNWFDSLNHAMTALSTGGFSTRVDSIGYYQSIRIELVTIILMLLGTTNFAILALLFKGNFSKIRKIGELKFFLILLVIFIPVVLFLGINGVYASLSEGIRTSSFQVISALSTTGFSTVAYDNWRPDMMFMLIILMLIGGGAGATAGGIKYSRIYVLFKYLIFSIEQRFMPERAVNKAIIYKPQGKITLTSKYIVGIANFVFAYVCIFFIGTLIMVMTGISLEDALFEFASSLGTVGLSVGVTSNQLPLVVLGTQIVAMILGRLEIFIVIIFVLSIKDKIIDLGKKFKLQRSNH